MKNKLYLAVALLLTVFGSTVMIMANTLFLDHASNPILGYLTIQRIAAAEEGKPIDQNQTLYIPKGIIEFSINNENQIMFNGFAKEEPSSLSDEGRIVTDKILLIEKAEDLILYAPDFNIMAGDYEFDKGSLVNYFDKYTLTEAQDKFENSIWNDEGDLKRNLAFILGNLCILASIILIHRAFKDRPRLLLGLNIGGILLIITITTILMSFYYSNQVMTAFAIFCWVIYVISYSALNFKKLLGKEAEQIFP